MTKKPRFCSYCKKSICGENCISRTHELANTRTLSTDATDATEPTHEPHATEPTHELTNLTLSNSSTSSTY